MNFFFLFPQASSSSLSPFINTNESTFPPKSIMTHTWCKFCEENQNENTYEVKRNDRDRIFGKRLDTTIVVLYWYEIEDVMVVNARE
jgi:hypothetical protein